jgi:hypothetical protein
MRSMSAPCGRWSKKSPGRGKERSSPVCYRDSPGFNERVRMSQSDKPTLGIAGWPRPWRICFHAQNRGCYLRDLRGFPGLPRSTGMTGAGAGLSSVTWL